MKNNETMLEWLIRFKKLITDFNETESIEVSDKHKSYAGMRLRLEEILIEDLISRSSKSNTETLDTEVDKQPQVDGIETWRDRSPLL